MKNILIIFLFSGLYLSLFAQDAVSEDSLFSLQRTENFQLNSGSSNIASIKQVGNFNEASINQTKEFGYFPNSAFITQQGNSNYALSNQEGSSNLTLIGQYGSHNSADINVDGHFNLAGVLQLGNDNFVEQDLIGNGLTYGIIQIGTDNMIRHVQTEQEAMPMDIQQRGNGMRLTIINGNFK